MAAVTIARMAFTVGDHEVHPLTADDVTRMLDAGIIDGKRVELLRGVLLERPVSNPPHAEIVMRLFEWLAAGFIAHAYAVRLDSDFVVADSTSIPRPDVAVVEHRSYMDAHPSQALLLIEVSYSTLRTDRDIKAALYAESLVPEYWIVDVDARGIRVFTEPRAGEYRHTRMVSDGTVTPGCFEIEPLDLADLFAGLG